MSTCAPARKEDAPGPGLAPDSGAAARFGPRSRSSPALCGTVVLLAALATGCAGAGLGRNAAVLQADLERHASNTLERQTPVSGLDVAVRMRSWREPVGERPSGGWSLIPLWLWETTPMSIRGYSVHAGILSAHPLDDHLAMRVCAAVAELPGVRSVVFDPPLDSVHDLEVELCVEAWGEYSVTFYGVSFLFLFISPLGLPAGRQHCFMDVDVALQSPQLSATEVRHLDVDGTTLFWEAGGRLWFDGVTASDVLLLAVDQVTDGVRRVVAQQLDRIGTVNQDSARRESQRRVLMDRGLDVESVCNDCLDDARELEAAVFARYDRERWELALEHWRVWSHTNYFDNVKLGFWRVFDSPPPAKKCREINFGRFSTFY